MIADPVSDLITRIKNAGMVKKSVVNVPHSKLKLAIVEKLKDAGFVQSVEKRGKKVKKSIEVTLAYKEDGSPRVTDVKRISKPGRRMYRSVLEIKPIRYGHGALMLSTPKGIMTDAEARKEKVGGEALFEIW